MGGIRGIFVGRLRPVDEDDTCYVFQNHIHSFVTNGSALAGTLKPDRTGLACLGLGPDAGKECPRPRRVHAAISRRD